MAWADTFEVNGLEFGMGDIMRGSHHGWKAELMLTTDEIRAAGDRLPELIEWFLENGDEYNLVTNWRGTNYSRQMFTASELMIISRSKFATEQDREFLFHDPPRAARDVPKRKPAPGYIYVIRRKDGEYKIGKSKSAVDRIESLSVKLPFAVEPVCVIASDDMNGLEKQLHERFQDKRVNGEWFALTNEDVEYLKSL